MSLALALMRREVREVSRCGGPRGPISDADIDRWLVEVGGTLSAKVDHAVEFVRRKLELHHPQG